MNTKEGASVSCPPFLEGFNYPYWKVRTKAFINSVDKKAWIAAKEVWTPPIDEVDNKIVKKDAKCWNASEEKASLENP